MFKLVVSVVKHKGKHAYIVKAKNIGVVFHVRGGFDTAAKARAAGNKVRDSIGGVQKEARLRRR